VLEAALLSASRGDSQLVLLVGEAGSGKSRVCSSLREWAEANGWAVLSGACSDADISLPYLPVSEAISSYLAGADTTQLGAGAQELTELFPASGDAAGDFDDPTRGKLRLYEAVLALVREISTARGALIMIDDLQWADGSTRDLLDYLVRRLRKAPLMMLLTCRPEELDRRHPLAPLLDSWRRARLADEVVLRPLEMGEVAAMVAATLGAAEVPEGFTRRLWERSEGNPYVVEEILKELLDSGALGSGTITPGAGAELARRVPKRVSEGILLRVARMPPAQVEILECAAVLGRSFSYQTLAAVARAESASVLDALQASVRNQLVEEEPEFPSRYRFRHSLTRDAIYTDIVRPRRDELHVRAAEVLAGQSIASVAVANHLLAAERWDEAVPACLEAAADAVRQRGYAEAAELYERALAHLEPGERRDDAGGLFGEALWLAGQPGRALEPLAEAGAALRARGHLAGAAHLTLIEGRCRWETGDHEAAHACYEAARDELEPLGPSPDLALAYIRLAGQHTFEFEAAAARRAAQAALRIAEVAEAGEAAVWAAMHLGIALVYEGRVTEGLERMDRSYQQAKSLGYDRLAVNALHAAILLRLWNLRAAECPPLVAEMETLPGGWLRDMMAGRVRTATHLVRGNLGEAMAAAEATLAAMRDVGARAYIAWVNWIRAQVHAELGELAEARAVLPSRAASEERQDLFRVWFADARIALAARDLEAATAVAREILGAAEWAARLPMLVGLAAEILDAAGDPAAASPLIKRCQELGTPPDHPLLVIAAARATLAEDPAAAATAVTAAVEALRGAESRLEEHRGRCVLARCLAAAGDRRGAASELGDALAWARSAGARALEDEVWATADAVDLRLPRPARVEPIPAPAGAAAAATTRLALLHELRVALQGDQLRLLYQPKVALADGTLAGVEALVRWQHPRHGLLDPDAFVPLAEHSGLVKPLTSWALGEALRQAAAWRAAGLDLRVNVNLSTLDLEDTRLADLLARTLEEVGVDASRLVLEVTETGAMTHPQRAIQTLRELREIGAHIAIDDFGIGQSSLAYLRQLPVDEIKIDKSFCQDLDETNLVIVRSAVAMGHDLGLTVTAEGVETEAVEATLRGLGCDLGQGYLYGRPMTAEAIAQWRPVGEVSARPG